MKLLEKEPKVNVVLNNLMEFKGIKQKIGHMFVQF